MRKVYCLNGHDACGVEGFTCPICRAELRTVLAGHRAPALRPERLMAIIVLLPAAFVAVVTTRPQEVDAVRGPVQVRLALVGAALWLAACTWVAAAFNRSGDEPCSPAW